MHCTSVVIDCWQEKCYWLHFGIAWYHNSYALVVTIFFWIFLDFFFWIMLPGIHVESMWNPYRFHGFHVFHADNHWKPLSGLYMEWTWNEDGFHKDSTRIPCILERKFPFWDILPGIHVESTWTPWSLPGFHKEAWGRVKYWITHIVHEAYSTYSVVVSSNTIFFPPNECDRGCASTPTCCRTLSARTLEVAHSVASVELLQRVSECHPCRWWHVLYLLNPWNSHPSLLEMSLVNSVIQRTLRLVQIILCW